MAITYPVHTKSSSEYSIWCW